MDPVDAAPGGADSPLIVLRVVIRSPDVDTFIAKYSRFLKDDRIFIFTKASQPPGTRVRFTLELADGPALLHGEGTVTRIRPDQGDPAKPPGMELRFEPVDQASREMVARMANARGTTQLPMSQPIDVATPAAEPDSAPGNQTGTNPGTQVPTNPGAQLDSNPGSLPRMDEASTKIRTGSAQLPVHTPSGGTALPPAREEVAAHQVIASREEHRPREERTDVDAAANQKFRTPTPPPFTTTPTPLPAPLPLPTIMTPPHGMVAPNFGSESPTRNEKGDAGRPTQPVLPSLTLTPAFGVVQTRGDEHTGAFATVDGQPAPRFAESYVGPLPAPPGAPPSPTGTVPANPFAEISDNTIEYFVAWSLEQSTTPHPKSKPPAAAKFANVPIRAPRRERDPASGARLRLAIGILVGLALGIPLGAVGMWAFKPFQSRGDDWMLPRAARTARPVETPIASHAVPKVKPPENANVNANANANENVNANANEPKTVVSSKPVVVSSKPEEKPVEPPAPVAEKPAEKPADELPSPPSLGVHKGKTATLRLRSIPPGAEVLVKGEPHGMTPVDIELPPNHRYDVTITLAGKKPWKKRINLAPPLTEVMASWK